ncbi:MAG: DUF6783 domain-containing protein [Ruminococcus sp.]
MKCQQTRACLKKVFRKIYVTIYGKFYPDEGIVTCYDNRIQTKYTAKSSVQIAGMIFKCVSQFTGTLA